MKCVHVSVHSGSLPYGWTLADWLVFGAVRRALGLDRCQLFLASAAPMMKETLEFFHSLNIPVMEIYGTSECAGKSGICSPQSLLRSRHYGDESAVVNLPV